MEQKSLMAAHTAAGATFDDNVKAKAEVLVVQDFGIMDLLLNRWSLYQTIVCRLFARSVHDRVISFAHVAASSPSRRSVRHLALPPDLMNSSSSTGIGV